MSALDPPQPSLEEEEEERIQSAAQQVDDEYEQTYNQQDPGVDPNVEDTTVPDWATSPTHDMVSDDDYAKLERMFIRLALRSFAQYRKKDGSYNVDIFPGAQSFSESILKAHTSDPLWEKFRQEVIRMLGPLDGKDEYTIDRETDEAKSRLFERLDAVILDELYLKAGYYIVKTRKPLTWLQSQLLAHGAAPDVLQDERLRNAVEYFRQIREREYLIQHWEDEEGRYQDMDPFDRPTQVVPNMYVDNTGFPVAEPDANAIQKILGKDVHDATAPWLAQDLKDDTARLKAWAHEILITDEHAKVAETGLIDPYQQQTYFLPTNATYSDQIIDPMDNVSPMNPNIIAKFFTLMDEYAIRRELKESYTGPKWRFATNRQLISFTPNKETKVVYGVFNKGMNFAKRESEGSKLDYGLKEPWIADTIRDVESGTKKPWEGLTLPGRDPNKGNMYSEDGVFGSKDKRFESHIVTFIIDYGQNCIFCLDTSIGGFDKKDIEHLFLKVPFVDEFGNKRMEDAAKVGIENNRRLKLHDFKVSQIKMIRPMGLRQDAGSPWDEHFQNGPTCSLHATWNAFYYLLHPNNYPKSRAPYCNGVPFSLATAYNNSILSHDYTPLKNNIRDTELHPDLPPLLPYGDERKWIKYVTTCALRGQIIDPVHFYNTFETGNIFEDEMYAVNHKGFATIDPPPGYQLVPGLGPTYSDPIAEVLYGNDDFGDEGYYTPGHVPLPGRIPIPPAHPVDDDDDFEDSQNYGSPPSKRPHNGSGGRRIKQRGPPRKKRGGKTIDKRFLGLIEALLRNG